MFCPWNLTYFIVLWTPYLATSLRPLISQFFPSFLASSVYSFLWMFPLNSKTYHAFLIIKQRVTESSGCQPIILLLFFFLVTFFTCIWCSHDYFLLVLLINPWARWQCLPWYLMCTWIIELLRIRNIWLFFITDSWATVFFCLFRFVPLPPFPLFYSAFQGSLRGGLGLFLSSA